MESARQLLKSDGFGDALLLVTAHPDDEVMFFAPALLCLGEEFTIYILCLSTGDYDGLGAIRKLELTKACAQLGIPPEHVTVIDHDELRDGPNAKWPAARIAALVDSELRRCCAQRVLTFDERGITRHPNHIDVHRGVRQLVRMAMQETISSSGSESTEPAVGYRLCAYQLHSVGLLRRYLGLWDTAATLIWAALSAATWSTPMQTPSPKLTLDTQRPVVCFIWRPWRAAWLVHCAMREHASQYVWFRRLYVLLSRYVFVNTLYRIAV